MRARRILKEAGLILVVGAAFIAGLFLTGYAGEPITMPFWVGIGVAFLVLTAYILGKPLISGFFRRGSQKRGDYFLVDNLLWKPEWKGGKRLPGSPLCNWCQTEVLILPGKAAYHQAIYSQCPSCGAINEYSMSYPQLLEDVEKQLPGGE